jgi:hypothetical protein
MSPAILLLVTELYSPIDRLKIRNVKECDESEKLR